MSILAEKFGAQDKIADIGECDEYAVHLSFKGKRDPEFFVRALGRLPRQHMSYSEKLQYLERNGLLSIFDNNPDELDRLLEGTRYLPGTNRDSVCILTAKDRSGNLFIKPTCVGGITSSNVQEQFKDRFAEDSIMVTDGSNAYKDFAEMENIRHEQVNADAHAKGPFSLARVNALHSQLNRFWPSGSGKLPATKYIDLYLILFWWLQKQAEKTTDQKVDELFSYVKGQTSPTLDYDSLKERQLPLDTKGIWQLIHI